jgi:hypothetical protein
MIALFFFGLGSMILFSLATTMLTEFMPGQSSSGVAVSLSLLNSILPCYLGTNGIFCWLAQQSDEKCLLGCWCHRRCPVDLCYWKWVAVYYSRDIDLGQCFCGVVDEALWATMAREHGQNPGMRLQRRTFCYCSPHYSTQGKT